MRLLWSYLGICEDVDEVICFEDLIREVLFLLICCEELRGYKLLWLSSSFVMMKLKIVSQHSGKYEIVVVVGAVDVESETISYEDLREEVLFLFIVIVRVNGIMRATPWVMI